MELPLTERYPYLAQQNPEFREVANVLLELGEIGAFLVHTQLISHHSPHLATVFRLSLPDAAAGRHKGTADVGEPSEPSLPVVRLNAEALPPAVTAVSKKDFERFLLFIYDPLATVDKVEEAAALLTLADYFQVHFITRRVEAWMCAALHLISTKPGLDELACSVFELATKFRLTQATALLLPWVLQRLSFGSRQGVVWYDSQRINQRLIASLSQELKALCFDAAMWWCHAHAPTGRCAVCGCRTTDLTPAFERERLYQHYSCLSEPLPPHYSSELLEAARAAEAAAQAAWSQRQQLPPPPRQRGGAGGAGAVASGANSSAARDSHLPTAVSACPYQRAVAHFAHMLRDSSWGMPSSAASASPPRASTCG